MIYRLFALPAFLVMQAIIAWVFLGVFIPVNFGQSPIFSSIVKQSSAIAGTVALWIFLFAVLVAAFKLLELRSWYQGNSMRCGNCGGLVELRTGRYGLYYHCLACGKNKRC